MIDSGTVELFAESGDGTSVTVHIFYHPTGNPATENIINTGTPGRALEAINTSTRSTTLYITGPTGTVTQQSVPPGTSTLTANQLSNLGINTRTDAQGYSISSP